MKTTTAGIAFIVLLFAAGATQAADHLLFLEAQGIAGYSTRLSKPIYYSMNPDAEMQKPTIGFDYLHKLAGAAGDIGTFALQARLALVAEGKSEYKLEGQVYNAYLKLKTPYSDVWIGHNRPAFGLGSYFDSHGLLLRTLAIQGIGYYDRDWGLGAYRDYQWGNAAASLTTGSGMPAYVDKGNYMAATRASLGVLNEDNYNIGLSLGYGRTLDTMGYQLRERNAGKMRLLGMDAAYLRNNLEHRFDGLIGTWLGEDTYGFSYRLGVLLNEEGSVKIEAQPMLWKVGRETDVQMGVCVSDQVTSNLTGRVQYEYDQQSDDHRVIVQLYYYRPM